MKTIYKIATICLCLVAAVSCNKNDSQFNVTGDCLIDSLVLDDIYPGVVDHASATVTVAVPEVHDDHLMTITTLRLSAGAKATPAQGAQVNMTSPIVIHVENGNVYRDYKVRVKHDEARILSFMLGNVYRDYKVRVKHDEARILSFMLNELYVGIIDQVAHTITVSVPIGTDIKTMIPNIKTTDGATVSPQSGLPCDFTNPVDFTVTYNTASTTYKVTVKDGCATQPRGAGGSQLDAC